MNWIAMHNAREYALALRYRMIKERQVNGLLTDLARDYRQTTEALTHNTVEIERLARRLSTSPPKMSADDFWELTHPRRP